MSNSCQLGEKVTISAIYKEDKAVAKDGGIWRVSFFQGKPTPQNYPEKMCTEESETKTFLAKGKVVPEYSGQVFDLNGFWEFDKKTKEFVFSFELAVPNVPNRPDDIMNFLRNAVPGIGNVLSQRIFDWANGDLQKIAEDPVVTAASIKGLSERRARVLAVKIQEASAMSSLTRLLNGTVDGKLVRKLVEVYGKDAYNIIKHNPYEATPHIGFDAADLIAMVSDKNFAPDKPERIKAAILFCFDVLKKRQNSIIVERNLHYRKTEEALTSKKEFENRVPESAVLEQINNLTKEDVLSLTRTYMYRKEDMDMEKHLSQLIYDMGQKECSIEERARFCAFYEQWKLEHPDIHLHVHQEDAVLGACHLLSVVTGGPGRGKTTVLQAIIQVYQMMFPDSPITLMAPTGLAAKRMTEACGRKSVTIHKQLNLTPAPTTSGFDDSRSKKIHGGLVIVDEFSMVGIHLANFLISAVEIRPDTRIVFVGDVDQLAPVSPGSVLKDLIECGAVHVTRLTKNFRQAGGSNIADISDKINAGNIQDLHYGGDCLFTKVHKDEDIRPILESEFMKSVQQFGLEQTFVITPTHKSEEDPLSSNTLNKRLQELVNHSADEVEVGNWTFKVGDRVINKKNTEECINGDIGYIRKIIPEDVGVSLEIEFSGGLIKMPPERIRNLELAYAITVHSSQGCEFKSVITPVAEAHKVMLTRNLIYTAITRAKKQMHLIGIPREMNKCVGNKKTNGPSDLLCKRIEAKMKGKCK